MADLFVVADKTAFQTLFIEIRFQNFKLFRRENYLTLLCQKLKIACNNLYATIYPIFSSAAAPSKLNKGQTLASDLDIIPHNYLSLIIVMPIIAPIIIYNRWTLFTIKINNFFTIITQNPYSSSSNTFLPI